jgi:rhomboid domain-containing protein 1
MNSRVKPKQAIFLLIGELLRSERLPPVTLSVIALNILVYLELFHFRLPSLASICISANSIIKNRQWLKLILSSIFHVDDWHLYYNMISFSFKGRTLEKRYGSRYFLIILGLFTIMTSLFYVGIELVAYNLFNDYNYLNNCAVGFSGVIFALKVLTTYYLPGGTVYLLEVFPLPSKYAYWCELIAISLVTQNASFAGLLNI